MKEALDIQVKGIVQGVGFRPFVYRLAKRYLVTGWVRNTAGGVFIHAEGDAKLLDEFVMELSDNSPAASQVTEIDLAEVPLADCDVFEIQVSDSNETKETTLVSPDLATCNDCVQELFDPENRRFRYPFINCTNCGPRFTIIGSLPYDRPNTSMKDFSLCGLCATEYADPCDRRFHAQPDACFDCGPVLSFVWKKEGVVDEALLPSFDTCQDLHVAWAHSRAESDAILAMAVDLLMAGKILAVKGLGGFHLVCDAGNEQALALLRSRKQRDNKAFAVMMPDVAAVREVCQVNQAEEQTLSCVQAPIVLLQKKQNGAFAAGLADGLPELGVMLPNTPLQHLLMHDFKQAGGGNMLVMTSGNLHTNPIVIDDEEAYSVLGEVADAFIGHNRAILSRYDDSVVRVISAGSADCALQFIRRARGYAPLPLSLENVPTNQIEDTASEESSSALAKAAPSVESAILAAGSQQKSTFTLVRGNNAFVSQYIGDRENVQVDDAWCAALNRYKELFDIQPSRLVCDLHPEYLASKYAHEKSNTDNLALTEVQHHHAHVASVLAENNLFGPVCGIAFDGTGFGVDGAIWGGEVLLSNIQAFERFANFAYVPMPGGAAAVKHPLRMAYGVLWAFDLLDHPGAADSLAKMGEQAQICDQMIEQGINAPMTSSVGRLFDAASALLGICVDSSYEGEAAIMLEAATWDAVNRKDKAQPYDFAQVSERYAVAIVKNTATEASTAQDTSVVLFDAAATFQAVLDDKEAGVPTSVIARRFHDAMVQAIVLAANLVRSLYDINIVALSGGVFMNRYLIENTTSALENDGFIVALNRDLPPNDGSISFGQAVVAWALNSDR